MTQPKQFSSPMPDVLFVIDNDFEQRYYRSPKSAATGVCGWLTSTGTLHAYRRIDEGFDAAKVLAARDQLVTAEESEFNKIVGPNGYQPQAPNGPANWAAWLKVEKQLRKLKVSTIAALLEKVR